MVTAEQLEKLKEPMPYKWRVQSTKYGKCTVVAYVDARQVQDKLDEVLGGVNWQNDFKLIDGKLFGGVGVNTEDGWIWKWDTGVESNMDAEKGQVSDAFKRAAVHFGVGRFLYSLGIVTLNAKEHTNKKEYPATREGKILWNSEELNAYVSKIVAEGVLDDTKPNKASQATQTAKTTKATPAKEKAAEAAPKQAEAAKEETKQADQKVKLVDDNGNIQPNLAAIEPTPEAERKEKAKAYFAKLADEATVLKFLIKDKGVRKFAKVSDYIDNTPIDEVLTVYKELREKLGV